MKYNPHDYQIYAINFIKEHPIAAILLDMGMGKTSIVLAALNDLMFDSFEVTKVLIIAPLRVAKHTWSAEIQKWDQLRGLRYSIAVGTAAERMKALQADADIYIINRENVPWLIEKSGLPFDYDMVVIDELSSFKNWQAKRFKALMKVRPRVKRIVGLTGTPSSNGLMSLQNTRCWTWENALEDLSASTGSNTLCPIRRTVRLFTAIGSGRVLTRGFMTESPISRFP